MIKMSDRELADQTVTFKGRLAEGEGLDDILPEAFAAVCEADRRILGMEPFDVQILGGIALHQGYLTEMNTGEGKTLTATMPLYLNALTGKSTILVTENDYLALRDAEEMGAVYRFMGLSVAAGVCPGGESNFTNAQKKTIYSADIVYTTHGILGFDYLLDNLTTTAKDRFLREFYYVIIDEADAVLLDAAQTPLVISGAPRVRANLYKLADLFVSILTEGVDYEQEDRKVWLTDKGIKYAETFFQIDNFYSKAFFEINRHVTLALRAHVLYQKGEAYLLSDQNEITLLDRSGRMMPGVQIRGGQHQAIETKEKLNPSRESRSVAAITFQNLFRLFPKMSGMSGTLADASEELWNVYGARVLVIPPNRPIRRKDLPDLYFRDAASQFRAAILMIMEIHWSGRPVLVVVSSIAETELLSQNLIKKKIPHNVLNASNAFWEADIIKEAGRRGAVTISTSMAGRGTDIKLGEGVEELGGLAVIGIGRMANVRMERQAKGRAGRQGNAGSSRFLVSLEDEVVESNGAAHDQYIEGKKRISKYKLKKIIGKAQALEEEHAMLSRKHAVEYDQVIRYQRELIYATRNNLLEGGHLQTEQIMEIARNNIDRFLHSEQYTDINSLNRYILDNIDYRLDKEINEIALEDRTAMEEYLLKKVRKRLTEQEKCLGNRDYMKEFMRIAILNAIDNAWVEQVDYLQQLQVVVAGRTFAQRNLLLEYQNDAFISFQEMEKIVFANAVRNILLSDVYVDEEYKLHILFP